MIEMLAICHLILVQQTQLPKRTAPPLDVLNREKGARALPLSLRIALYLLRKRGPSNGLSILSLKDRRSVKVKDKTKLLSQKYNNFPDDFTGA